MKKERKTPKSAGGSTIREVGRWSTKAPTVICNEPVGLERTLQSGGGVAASVLTGSEDGDRYDDEGTIGSGGMGVVHSVSDRVLHRSVAMKVLDGSSSRWLVQRFIEEAQITGQLDHPNIVPVHDLGVVAEGSSLYFTMKRVEGTTLTEYFAQLHGARLDARVLEDALGVVLKVCEAMAFAHSRGVIHRDLKPENIMVGSHGQVYVMDWGVALLVSGKRLQSGKAPLTSDAAGLSDEGEIAGTPSHMAPEQARGAVSRIDERTDVYGIGGVLYDLLTGRGPHAAASIEESLESALLGTVPEPTELGMWPELPPELCRITMRALAHSPDDRYQSVRELAEALSQLLRGGGWFAERSYHAGELVFAEGAEGDSAFIVVSGKCEAFKEIDGNNTAIREMGPGDVFGELAVLAETPRTAGVVALTALTLRVVTKESLERELDRNPWLGRFVTTLAERFLEADQRLRKS